MTDLARLAIQIDSSQADGATKDLDQLTRAGERAESQVQDLGRASKQASTSLELVRTSASRSRYAMVDLGAQMNDFGTQVMAGTSIAKAFAMQAGQVAFALSQFEGKLGSVGAFMTGPWGAAITLGISALALFAENALSAGDAQDKQSDAAKQLKKDTEDLAEALKKATMSERDLGVAALNTANRLRDQAREALAATVASLKNARAVNAANRSGLPTDVGGAPGGGAIGFLLEQREVSLTKELTAAQKDLATATSGVRLRQAELIQMDVAEHLDKSKAATDRYKQGVADLNKQFTAGKMSQQEYARQYETLTRTYNSAEDALKNHRRGLSDAEKAARAAAKAQRELDAELKNIMATLDPATASWAKYTEQLEKIAKLKSAGMINADQADALSIKAGLEELKREQEAEAQAAKDVLSHLSPELQAAAGILTDNWERVIHPDVEALIKMFQKDGLLPKASAPTDRIADSLGSLFGQKFDRMIHTIDRMTGGLEKIFGENSKLGATLQTIAQGADLGGLAGGGSTGSKIGGAIGAVAGKAIGKSISALGKIGGPLGEVVGSLLGGVLGGLIKPPVKYGRASVSMGATGAQVGQVAGVSQGNSGARVQAAKTAAGNIANGINQLADLFGAALGDFGSITVGIRDKDWRVNLNGTSLKKSGGATDFGKGDTAAEQAIEFAIAEAIKRGALIGLRDTTQALLTNGGDLQVQIAKAQKLEDVFHDLAMRLDPVGTAIDDLNKQFDALRRIAQEAGASTEELAQIEQDYELQKADAIKQAAQAAEDLKHQKMSIQAQILDLAGYHNQAIALQRQIELEGLDASLTGLQKQLYAWQDAADVADKFQPFIDSLTAFRKSLFSGADSPLTYNQALAKLMQTGGLASTGDTTALGNLQGDAQTFLDAAKKNAKTYADYQRAVALVARYVDQGVAGAQGKIDYAKQSAESLSTVVDLLTSIDMSLAPGGAAVSGTIPVNNAATLEQLQEMAAQQLQMVTSLNWLQRFFTRMDRGTGLAISTDDPLPVEAAS